MNWRRHRNVAPVSIRARHPPADQELAPTAQRSASVNSSETSPRRPSADSAPGLRVSRRLAAISHPDQREPAIRDIRNFHPLTIMSTGVHGNTDPEGGRGPPQTSSVRGGSPHTGDSRETCAQPREDHTEGLLRDPPGVYIRSDRGREGETWGG